MRTKTAQTNEQNNMSRVDSPQAFLRPESNSYCAENKISNAFFHSFNFKKQNYQDLKE